MAARLYLPIARMIAIESDTQMKSRTWVFRSLDYWNASMNVQTSSTLSLRQRYMRASGVTQKLHDCALRIDFACQDSKWYTETLSILQICPSKRQLSV